MKTLEEQLDQDKIAKLPFEERIREAAIKIYMHGMVDHKGYDDHIQQIKQAVLDEIEKARPEKVRVEELIMSETKLLGMKYNQALDEYTQNLKERFGGKK